MSFKRRPKWAFLDKPKSSEKTEEQSSNSDNSVKMTLKQAQTLMWQSIQAQDLEGLKLALKNGANVHDEKKKNTPLIWAFEMGDIEMAKIIMKAKPKLNVISAAYENLFTIALKKESIPLAELLCQHDPNFADFQNIQVLVKSASMTQWWLDKKLPLKFDDAHHTNTYFGHRTFGKNPLWMHVWTVIAFQHWNKGILEQLSTRLLETEPDLQNKPEWNRCLTAEFMNVFDDKRLDILQTMAESNWMPYLTPVNIKWMTGWTSRDEAPDKMVSLFWLAAHCQHVEGMEFLLQSPEILKQARLEAQTLKEKLFGILGVHVPTLEVVSKTGLSLFEVVDFTHVFQESGYQHKETPFEAHIFGTFLHAKSMFITKALLEWTFKQNPDAPWEVNGMGETIFDILKESKATLGYDASQLGEGFLKKYLKKNIDKASSKPKSQSVKKRL